MKTSISVLLALVLIVGGFLLYEKHDSDSGVESGTVPQHTVGTSTQSTPAPTGITDGAAAHIETNDIKISSPAVGETVSSPLTVSGQARGNWYFEATAPVYLEDATGKKLAQGHIQATADWMTTNFVPFTGALTWTASSTATTSARLVFMNDNPSGDPALQKTVIVPVVLAK